MPKAPHIVRPYTIEEMTNSNPRFYQLIGPFLSRRDIVGELGSPVWDDPGKRWFVALEWPGDSVLGCVGLVQKRTHTLVASLYVVPEGRKQVIGSTLLLRALAKSKGEVRAVATPAAYDLFLAAGFKDDGAAGRFMKVKRRG